MSTLTDNTNTIPQLRDQLAARLEASCPAAMTVSQYRGTSAAGLLLHMLAQNLPAGVIYWAGEDANREPGRPQRTYNDMHLMLLAEDALRDEGDDRVQAMLDGVKVALDDYVSGNTLWRYMHSEPVDLSAITDAPNISAIDVTFEVGDH